jgi:peptidoglycan hydrolase-like protein with peptidoglycan-binding domain
MDVMVLATQQWLNSTYGNDSRFGSVEEDGYTGWNTVYGLIRALQIELGITATANNFGPSTVAKFNAKFPNGIVEQESEDEREDNVYSIIQGALWCKGYSTSASAITSHFYGGTGSAIKRLKTDMGFENPTSTVTLNVMKALLSMDQFVYSIHSDSQKIRIIQQRLNVKYENYIGIIPCDGCYGRAMNKALIYVLQAVEGQSTSAADGSLGPGTQSMLPILPDEKGVLSAQQIKDASDLVKYALVCNGYEDVNLDLVGWDTELSQVIAAFQADMALAVTGSADEDTWMSLLLSKGNPSRAAKACDTRFEMTDARIKTLKENGYEIVGRYINGTEFKVLRDDEPARILNSGLQFFPIFQDSGTSISYFTAARGEQDAITASLALRKFKIPEGTICYFAVDMDALDTQITSNIIPYFNAISKHFDCLYGIGVYGTRNVCARVSEVAGVRASFVSDMSTAFSGNMGFKMPSNWNYDQFSEISMESDWAIDKDAYSGKFPAVSSLDNSLYIQPPKPTIPEETPSISTVVASIRQLEDLYSVYVGTEDNTAVTIAVGVTNFLRSFQYDNFKWLATTLNPINSSFIAYVRDEAPTLYNSLLPYVAGEDVALFTDGIEGQIDLAHLSATAECYMQTQPVPDFWTGWGGDLATGMKQVGEFLGTQEGQNYSIQSAANRHIGIASGYCNYSDMCTDADAMKIAQLVKNASIESIHAFSDTIATYYSGLHKNRFSYYLEDIDSNFILGNLKNRIWTKMNNFFSKSVLIRALAGDISDEIKRACCYAFANYLHKELHPE